MHIKSNSECRRWMIRHCSILECLAATIAGCHGFVLEPVRDGLRTRGTREDRARTFWEPYHQRKSPLGMNTIRPSSPPTSRSSPPGPDSSTPQGLHPSAPQTTGRPVGVAERPGDENAVAEVLQEQDGRQVVHPFEGLARQGRDHMAIAAREADQKVDVSRAGPRPGPERTSPNSRSRRRAGGSGRGDRRAGPGRPVRAGRNGGRRRGSPGGSRRSGRGCRSRASR